MPRLGCAVEVARLVYALALLVEVVVPVLLEVVVCSDGAELQDGFDSLGAPTGTR